MLAMVLAAGRTRWGRNPCANPSEPLVLAITCGDRLLRDSVARRLQCTERRPAAQGLRSVLSVRDISALTPGECRVIRVCVRGQPAGRCVIACQGQCQQRPTRGVHHNSTTAVVAGSSRDSDRPSLSSGTRAPDFQYQSYDAMWQHLHNVLEHGDVLLVFGATDVDLRTLERERESLMKSGVMPSPCSSTTTATCGPRSAGSVSPTACLRTRRARSDRSSACSTPASVGRAARGS